ncbi:SDR family oxidoreductase, partial [Candidatus Pelagibacter sp.]|nr:SDR family oxidoreductase [Candidatus Pelagibacter sp.]
KIVVSDWIKKNNFDVMIHLAALVPIKTVNKNKKLAQEVNFLGTKNIIDAIIKSNVRWFFFSSTSHVYKSSKIKISENSLKKPISYYGKTKLNAENYIIKKLKKTKVDYCIGRIFSTSNVSQKKNYLVPDLIYKIKNTKNKIVLRNLNHYRDFISMHEISKIIIKLYNVKFKGIVNIGMGKGVLLKDIAKLICKKFKKKYEFVDNTKPTYLIANNKKLKKYIKLRKINNLEKIIF